MSAQCGPRGHLLTIGTPEQIVDVMEHWFHNGAADGFNVMPAWLPGSLVDFVDLVIPELQRRGLFRTDTRDQRCERTSGCGSRRAGGRPWNWWPSESVP